ncbi:fungal-specific transcription factor domain-containing protein [Macrophomina phaseolina]|uniref:Fungal-specific transcription factor domain-containing protein n=1 Tax=Macrophomina phaseolina TaxID=35725 RepID=A0ABQ8GFC0_9PEZI|nr:fungal-specific transcription factor domain-containing protein [Macrophomina phaseolina]
MFTTFYGTSPRATGQKGAAPAKSHKRSQVRRACDWCKLMRIKCDSRRPCHNCQQAGRECATNGENQFRSIVAAVKEIERLRAQVREFESSRKQEPKSPSALDQSRRDSLSDAYVDRPSASRNGVRLDSILYGVASLPFFLTRMRHFLLQADRPPPQLDISTCTGGAQTPLLHHRDCLGADFLPRAQEEHFLDLFWQTHYFSFPILSEGQFRREYQALWADAAPGAPRKPSPLVDIVLALCIQLGAFLIHHAADPAVGSSPEAGLPPSLSGFQYYSRCQEAIDQTIESPSITTVQCNIFSVVYLYEAGLLNRAQVVSGKAIMTAMILGLPNEPLGSEPETQKEVARRTWWSLYILDAKLCMEVGRPPVIGPSHSTCQLPSDSAEIAQSLGPHYMFDDTCLTWLGFQTQTLRLLNAVRAAQSAFYAKYDSIVGANGYQDFGSNGPAREESARVVAEQMKELHAWARQVPDGYLVPRRDGQPYSTDRSPLDLSTDIPIHCQRQRLLLELQYHQYCVSLYQPFICFGSTATGRSTPLSDSKAVAGLNHAMTLTGMVHQALTSSEVLNGVYHVFRWQKNALFTMLGFAYTFPVSHSTAAARKAIDTAIAVVDMYRDILPEAGPVAAIARTLADDVNAVTAGFRTGRSWSSASSSALSLASPADASSASQPGAAAPAKQEASNKQDLATLSAATAAAPPTADDLFDLGLLQELGEVGTSWETMDMLWASLDPDKVLLPGTGAGAGSWAAMGGLDVVASGGLGEGGMDSS